MIDRKFIEYVANKLGIERKDLIEKDIILQILLNELTKNKEFKENFAFKGGTCLIKVYLGYFRFSEDLDFTYLNQKDFIEESKNKTRKSVSEKIDRIGDLIAKIAKNFNLDFKIEKENRKYFEFGGGNAFVTFKIWYDSMILNRTSFIKIQINFIEELNYEIKELPARFILSNRDEKETEFLFSNYSSLITPVKIKAYDLKEILIEKVRAILTRRGIKARDFIDIYLIERKIKIELKSLEQAIVAKIMFMLKYEKYLNNIKSKADELDQGLRLGEEQDLLLKPLPGDFEKFIKEIRPFLKEVIRKVLEKY